MISFSFTFNLNFFSKHRGSKAGWGSTNIELASRLGWNFFTRIRLWNKATSRLLPPVTQLRIRMVEYYGEIKEEIWNYIEKKHDLYYRFDDTAHPYPQINTRLIQTIYRIPFLTITNTYHTELDEQRHEEFRKELDKSLE